MRQHQAAALTLLLAGCSANWRPLAVPQPKPLPERTVVEFRAKDSVVTLHGVRFTADSVSGIWWLEHLTCDPCRVSYPLTAISQVRTGTPGAAAWWLLGPFMAVMAIGTAVGIALAGAGGN